MRTSQRATKKWKTCLIDEDITDWGRAAYMAGLSSEGG